MTASTGAINGTEKGAEIKAQYKKFIGRKIFFILFSLISIFVVAGVSTSLGSANIPVPDTYSAIFHKFAPDYFNPRPFETNHLFNLTEEFEEDLNNGVVSDKFKEEFETKEGFSPSTIVKEKNDKWMITDEKREKVYFVKKEETLKVYMAMMPKTIITIVWDLRLSRTIMGVLAGMGLAIAGTMMQGILRNPLASPFTLGIASSAGFGAVVAICLGAGIVGGKYLIIGNAFLFALIPTFVILGLTRYKRATPETMILAGIALMYIFSALTHLINYFAESEAVKEAYFWMVGSLSRVSWDELIFHLNTGHGTMPLPGPVPVVLICCVIPLIWKSWDVNVMGAGDETAKSLGVNVERTRVFVFVMASLLTAGIVCFTGTIGFVGLVAPHICRIIIGGDNRFLIPASGLFGGAFLLACDIVARTIMAPVILQVGIITALTGGPFLFFLLIRRRREYW